jgi:uncharacterized protein
LEVFAIPIEGKFILYRPLRRTAFVGNQAMVDLALDLVHNGASSGAALAAPEEAVAFLTAIGFLEPDPSPPPPPRPSYCPTTAVLLLTNRCNLRCTYCYAAGGEGPVHDLSPMRAHATIDQVYRNAVELGQPYFELTFHGGGEPVQAWEALQEATIYARGKDRPCRISMVSNGVLSAAQREWLLGNMDSFSISFDGRQVTQDRQRPFVSGRGSFRAVMRTFEALDRANFSYGIRLTATSPWQDQLPEDVRFICTETGCPAMQVEPAFNTRRGEHQGPTQEQGEAFVRAFMEAFEIARGAGRQLTYSGARPWLLTRTFCTAPQAALIVNPAGKVVTCYEVADGHHPLAEMSTVGRVDGEKVVIDGRAMDAFQSYLDQKRAACRDCFCYWHCAGDCYTRASAAARVAPQGTSPRCHMNREITSRILLWYIMNGDGVWQGQGLHPQAAQLMRAF